MREYDYVVVGHLTIDELWSDASVELRLGGAASYGSVYVSGLGLSSAVVTKAGEDFPKQYIEFLRSAGVDLSGLSKARYPTTRFRITLRETSVVASMVCRSDSLLVADVAPFRGRVIHLGPVAGEISVGVVLQAKENSEILALDLQGILREVGTSGGLRLNPARLEPLRGIPLVAHANSTEAVAATGVEDPVSSAKILAKSFGIAAVTLGAEGAIVAGPEGTLRVSAVRLHNTVDDVGAGDVFTAALALALAEGDSLKDASKFASASAGASTMFQGPSKIPADLIWSLETRVNLTWI